MNLLIIFNKAEKEGNRMAYKDYIDNLRKEFVGKKVNFNGSTYTIVMVDYNGMVHIDKPSQYNKTTAVYDPVEARKELV